MMKSATYFRLKKKGNGWVVEKAVVNALGKVKTSEMGDWDLLTISEKKLYSAVNQSRELETEIDAAERNMKAKLASEKKALS